MTQKRDIASTKYEPICRVASTPVCRTGLRIRSYLIRIRNQHFGLNTDPDPDPDPDPIRIQGFDEQKLKKMNSFKKNLIFLDQKLQFTYP